MSKIDLSKVAKSITNGASAPIVNWHEDFMHFEKRCRDRLIQGQAEYGDRSFSEHPLTLLKEIQEELLDTACWSFIKWRRLAILEAHLREIE